MLPLPKDDKENQTKRRAPKKVPSYHLTGAKSMEYIKEADARTKEKEEKDKKTELVKKRSSKETQIIRKKGKMKQIVTVTRLITKPLHENITRLTIWVT